MRAEGRRIWNKNADLDDSGEILSYRAAVLILLFGGLYATGWLYLSGIPLWVTLIFLLVASAWPS